MFSKQNPCTQAYTEYQFEHQSIYITTDKGKHDQFVMMSLKKYDLIRLCAFHL